MAPSIQTTIRRPTRCTFPMIATTYATPRALWEDSPPTEPSSIRGGLCWKDTLLPSQRFIAARLVPDAAKMSPHMSTASVVNL